MAMHLETFKNRLSRNDASVNFLQGVHNLNALFYLSSTNIIIVILMGRVVLQQNLLQSMQ